MYSPCSLIKNIPGVQIEEK